MPLFSFLAEFRGVARLFSGEAAEGDAIVLSVLFPMRALPFATAWVP